MKEDIMRQAIGDIDDKLIEGSEKQQSVKRTRLSWVKWGSIAAAFVLVIATGIMILPGMLKGNDPVVTPDTPSTGGNEGINAGGYVEGVFEKGYTYSVDEGKYASYVKGKVIADNYVGEKLDDATVTAGWTDADGKMLSEEHARAEIYEIKGVSADTAVAIKFIDELEAQVTTMYYVIMNPEADLTPVQNYIITFDADANLDGDGNVQE